MAAVVVADYDRWPNRWSLDLLTGETSPVDASTGANGWMTKIDGHVIALVAMDGRLLLWVDGASWDIASLKLSWSTEDWSLLVHPTSRVLAVDRVTLEHRFAIEYPDPAWPIARIDPTYDGIDHDCDDLLYWIVREIEADEHWPERYLECLDREIGGVE